MNNIKVGQKAEYMDDTVEVTYVGPKTFDLNYADSVGKYPSPPTFKDRKHEELVDMGNGRVIWNHEP